MYIANVSFTSPLYIAFSANVGAFNQRAGQPPSQDSYFEACYLPACLAVTRGRAAQQYLGCFHVTCGRVSHRPPSAAWGGGRPRRRRTHAVSALRATAWSSVAGSIRAGSDRAEKERTRCHSGLRFWNASSCLCIWGELCISPNQGVDGAHLPCSPGDPLGALGSGSGAPLSLWDIGEWGANATAGVARGACLLHPHTPRSASRRPSQITSSSVQC